MDVKIVTLSENTAGMNLRLLGEHGLSIYVETPEFRLLFDTGQTVSAAHNAQVLGIDLKGVPIALSHGHVDHTGGLTSVLGKTLALLRYSVILMSSRISTPGRTES